MKTFTARLCLTAVALSILGACSLLPAGKEADVGGSEGLTVVIASELGIVDCKYRITVTVTEAASGEETSVALDVPEYSDSEAIAGGLALLLNWVGEIEAMDGETRAPRFAASPRQAEDLRLPPGFGISDVTIERRSERGPDSRGGRPVVYVTKERTGHGGREAEDAASVATPYRSFEFEVCAITGDPPATELGLYGSRGGQPVELHHEAACPGPPSHPLEELGSWLQSMGATVTYPSGTRMNAALPSGPAAPRIEEAHFSASEATGSSSPPTHELTYRFTAS